MRPRKSSKRYFYLILLVVIGIFIVKLLPEIEWSPPVVEIRITGDIIGNAPFDIVVTDEGKGLVSIKVELRDKVGGVMLYQQLFDVPVLQKVVPITLDSDKLGLKDGPATIVVTALDASKLRVFVGNKTVVKRNVTLDFTSPEIKVISPDPVVRRGGSGLVIFSSSEDTIAAYVTLGGREFPAYNGYFKEPNVYIALFSHPYDLKTAERARIVARDEAGNEATSPLGYKLKAKSFKRSVIYVSDSFIKRKALPLLDDWEDYADTTDAFLAVNNTLRRKNEGTIREETTPSEAKVLWNGPFHQLTNSKVEAGFADYRSYHKGGALIDRQYHLGYDLAVVKNYPVEAANHGKVVFTGDIGIYGKTAIVDHGLGLFSLYSHLSSIAVSEGEQVKRKGKIGHTGQTGLAGGDHLHFGMYISGLAVDPIEWWDRTWLYRNIISPIEEAERAYGVSEGTVGFLPR